MFIFAHPPQNTNAQTSFGRVFRSRAPMEPPAAAEPADGEKEADQDDLDAEEYEPGAYAGMEEDDEAAAAAAAAAAEGSCPPRLTRPPPRR